MGFAVIPLEFEDFFDNESEYLKERQKYQLYLFYHFSQRDALSEKERIAKIARFLKVPQHQELFQMSFLEYMDEIKRQKEVKNKIFAFGGAFIGAFSLVFSQAADIPRDEIPLTYILPTVLIASISTPLLLDKKNTYRSYFSSYSEFVEDHAVNLCLSSRYSQKAYDCSQIKAKSERSAKLFKELTGRQVVQGPQISQDSFHLKSPDNLSPEQSFSDSIPSVVVQLDSPTVPVVFSDSVKILHYWLGQLHPKNPDYKNTSSELALKKMSVTLKRLNAFEIDTLNSLMQYNRPQKWLKYCTSAALILGTVSYYNDYNDDQMNARTDKSKFGVLNVTEWSLLAFSATFWVSAYLDGLKLEQRQALLEMGYNKIQTKDIGFKSDYDEGEFWCKQLSSCQNNIKNILDVQQFINEKGIPENIYAQRTYLNARRSSPLWVISKVVLGVIGYYQAIKYHSEHHPKWWESLASFTPAVGFSTSLYFDYKYETPKEKLRQELGTSFGAYLHKKNSHPNQNEEEL